MTFLNGFDFRNSAHDITIDLPDSLFRRNYDLGDIRDLNVFNSNNADETENSFFSSRLPEFSSAWLKSFFTPQAGDDSAANFTPQTRDDKAANKAVLAAITSDPTDGDFSSQWHLQETETWGINIQGAWKDYVGVGVIVGAADSGFDTDHADLSNNYRDDIDFDFAFNDNDPSPIPGAPASTGFHGTHVIGIIGADDNGQEVVGVAPDADITGYQLNFDLPGATVSQWDSIEDANAQATTDLDVYNNSWGSLSIFNFDKNNPVMSAGIAGYEDLAQNGRNGLGVVTVFAAGNSRDVRYLAPGESVPPGEIDFTQLHPTLNVNYNNTQNSPYAITVAATNRDGTVASVIEPVSYLIEGQGGDPDITVTVEYIKEFSEPGAALLISAPGVDIFTTDPEGADGASTGDVVSNTGTSFAAPIISGVTALMLEANPDLGYRDVQEILAYSARQNDPNRLDPETGLASWQFNGAGNWNGGGLHFSHDYGFGLVDAKAAVRLAETWSLTQKYSNIASFTALTGPGKTLTNNATQTSTVNVASDITIERVIVDIDISGLVPGTQDDTKHLGDLVITLVSPDGTESVLMNAPPPFAIVPSIGSDFQFEFTSNAHWGESTAGIWTLELKDLGNHVGTKTIALDSWTLDFIADNAQDDVYIYTDEFSTVATTARKNFNDSSGYNIFNAAAVTTNTVINLANLTGTLAGIAITFASNAVVNEIIAGDGADSLTGDGDAELLSGMRGNDSLVGGAGNDTLIGGAGNDELFGDSGADDLNGGANRDTLNGGDGIDTLRGGTGNDILNGGAQADELLGGDGADTLNGELGDDTIQAGIGDDIIDGGDGSDFITASNGSDDVIGGNGNDTISGGPGQDSLNGDNGLDSILGGDGNDTINGGAQADLLSGGAQADILNGDTGDDDILGGDGNDTLNGGDGADSLRGNLDNDSLVGGNGNDTVNGGNGNDTISGGAGQDSLNGGNGLDSIVGGNGNDTINGGAQADLLSGGAQADILNGDTGDDDILGGDGNDTLNGGDGADLLRGNLDNDSLVGGNGNDTVNGGDGDDIVAGNANNDTLIGGNGDDTFVFSIGDLNDQIDDFNATSSAEKIDLSGMGASFDTFAKVSSASSQVGADVLIDFGGGDKITLIGVTLADLDSSDFIF